LMPLGERAIKTIPWMAIEEASERAKILDTIYCGNWIRKCSNLFVHSLTNQKKIWKFAISLFRYLAISLFRYFAISLFRYFAISLFYYFAILLFRYFTISLFFTVLENIFNFRTRIYDKYVMFYPFVKYCKIVIKISKFVIHLGNKILSNDASWTCKPTIVHPEFFQHGYAGP
jgi:hypothetical protein